MSGNDDSVAFIIWFFNFCLVLAYFIYLCNKLSNEKVVIIWVVCAYNQAKREGDTIETCPASPTFRNNVAIIRTENEGQSRSTTNIPTSMPVLPYGWSATGSNSHLYQPISSECPYPPQAYPAQMPYPLNTQNSNSSPRAGRTAPYPSQSSHANVPQPSAPHSIRNTSDEMDSPPNFEEAIKMCPKK